MKRLNIVTKRTYQGNDGTVKNAWSNVGSLVVFPATQDKEEGYAIELGMFPETKFYVFEQKKDEQPRRPAAAPRKPAAAPAAKADAGFEYPTEDINPEDIPF